MCVQTWTAELKKKLPIQGNSDFSTCIWSSLSTMQNAVLLLECLWNSLSSFQTKDVIIVGEREGIIEENLLRLDNSEDCISTN